MTFGYRDLGYMVKFCFRTCVDTIVSGHAMEHTAKTKLTGRN